MRSAIKILKRTMRHVIEPQPGRAASNAFHEGPSVVGMTQKIEDVSCSDLAGDFEGLETGAHGHHRSALREGHSVRFRDRASHGKVSRSAG